MKSIKLSESKRNDILSLILNVWEQNNKRPDVEKAQKNAAQRYYELGVPLAVRELEHQSVVKPFLRKGTSFMVSIQGSMHRFTLPCERPLPKENGHTPCILVLDEALPESEMLILVTDQYNDWKKQRETIWREAKEILASVSTTKQLIELWPQVEPFLPAYLVDPSKGVNLPAIPVSRINEKLGL